jgi:hypothetical protein
MPREEDGQPVRGQLGRADRVGVAQQEVAHRAGRGAFPMRRFEAVALRFAAVAADHLVEVGEVGEFSVGGIPAEAVASGLARQKVMQVPAHRLGLTEPALRHHVLAVVRQQRLHPVLHRAASMVVSSAARRARSVRRSSATRKSVAISPAGS